MLKFCAASTLSVLHNISFMLIVKMGQKYCSIYIWASNFQKFPEEACPQTPLEACVPMILGMVDSLARPSPH